LLDPALQSTSDELIVLVEVREVRESAVLDLVLIIPVVDLAFGVVVTGVVEGRHLRVVQVHWGHMVRNHVEHNPDVLFMASFDQILEFVRGAEVGVDVVPVEGSVAMVVIAEVLRNGRDPDGAKAKILDVVQLLLDALPGTSTVLVNVITVSGGVIRSPESISDDLVDAPSFPFLS